MVHPVTRLDPPPMPGVDEGRLYVDDAIAALQRAKRAWNFAQLNDALRSAATFLVMVTTEVARRQAKAEGRSGEPTVPLDQVALGQLAGMFASMNPAGKQDGT